MKKENFIVKTFAFGMVFFFLFVSLCGDYAFAQAQSRVTPVSAGSSVSSQASEGHEINALLDKYFRRIDNYMKQNKYRMAKNELKKIYLIDPTNKKAKDYALLIEKNEVKRLKNKEEKNARTDALVKAERKLKKQRELLKATERISSERNREDWSGSTSSAIVPPRDFDIDEFERLQEVGLEGYKQEVIAEAKRLLENDNYDKAIAKYRDALAIDPGDLLLKELLNKAIKEREERLDKIYRMSEEIEDRQFMQEVTKSAMGIDDYRRAMSGHGYAKPIVGRKPDRQPSIYEKLQMPVTADFRDVDLGSVINFLGDYTGINIIASQMILTENRPITVRFKELPLEKALKYLIKGQGLRYRIEDDLIWIATEEEMENEEMETRVYYLEKCSGVFSTFSSSNVGSLGSSGRAMSMSTKPSIKELLEEAVPFPPGAKIVFDQRTGALIVTNTPMNLQRIEEILYTIDEPPQQISIESRFIEVDMKEWENFGINTNMDSRLMVDTDNSIGALMQNIFTGVSSATPSSDTGGFVMNFSGLLTDPQFSMVLNMLNRMSKTKTLSAPKITTVNNQTATIKVVTEEVYPTKFEVSLIQQDLNGDGDLDDAGETEFANVPQEFVSRDVGIILQVTPSVGIDKKTITLSLVPEVSSVAQSPAKFAITNYDSEGNESGYRSSGTPNLPRFTTSTLSTTVVLESGETAVLGGLIKESRGVTEEKMPLLGDIPYVGVLFRSKQDNVSRTNLIIFITARVVST